MEELCDDRAEEIKIEIAIKLIKRGKLSYEEISEDSGLTLEEVKEIAGALGAGKRISLKEEPSVCCYQFSFQGEEAVLCHGVGHPTQPVPAKTKK